MTTKAEALTGKLSTRLREATQKSHKDLDSFEFFQSLQNDSLPKQSPVSYLRGLSVIHALLATAITAPTLAEYRIRQHERLDDLVAMLENNGAATMSDIPQATDAALQLGDELLRLPTDDHISLLGACYVLEGSQLGGQVLRDHLAKALDLPPDQVAYHGATGKEARQRWDAFRHGLDLMDLTEEQAIAMIHAASVTSKGSARWPWPLTPSTRTSCDTDSARSIRRQASMPCLRVRPMLPERCVAVRRPGDAFLTSKCVMVTGGDAGTVAYATRPTS